MVRRSPNPPILVMRSNSLSPLGSFPPNGGSFLASLDRVLPPVQANKNEVMNYGVHILPGI